MVDSTRFPQIPLTVWNGTRSALRRSPRIKFDSAVLSAELGVQVAAARQYLAELRRIGLLDEDGAATDLGQKWRLDEHLEETVGEILRTAYPDTLVDLAPPGHADRSKVESWFLNQGMGQGTARNKAGTYLMIANSTQHNADVKKRVVEKAPRGNRKTSTPKQVVKADGKAIGDQVGDGKGNQAQFGPLNVNLQIHISADASLDQINAIFSAMRSYLHGDEISQAA